MPTRQSLPINDQARRVGLTGSGHRPAIRICVILLSFRRPGNLPVPLADGAGPRASELPWDESTQQVFWGSQRRGLVEACTFRRSLMM